MPFPAAMITMKTNGESLSMFSCTPADDETRAIRPALVVSRDLRRLLETNKPRIYLDAVLFRRVAPHLRPSGLFSSAGARAAPANFTSPIVLTNFMLFDGKSKSLRGGLWLRVDGNRIKRIASGDLTPPEGVRMIDCGRQVMMPGLIDAHWHSIFAALPISALVSADVGYIFLAASSDAERTPLRGFTTVRDLGGPSFALKQAIDDRNS